MKNIVKCISALVLITALMIAFTGCGSSKPAYPTDANLSYSEPTAESTEPEETTVPEAAEETVAAEATEAADSTEPAATEPADGEAKPGETQPAEQPHVHSYKKTGEQTSTKTSGGKTEKTTVTTYTCACGDSYQDTRTETVVDGHTHSYTSKVTKAATCTAFGTRTYTCSCGSYYTETIPVTGHKYTSKITKQPTCAAEGACVYTCSACGSSYTAAVAKKPHSVKTETVHHDDVYDTLNITEVWQRHKDYVHMYLTQEGIDMGLGNGEEFGYQYSVKSHTILVADFWQRLTDRKKNDYTKLEYIFRYGQGRYPDGYDHSWDSGDAVMDFVKTYGMDTFSSYGTTTKMVETVARVIRTERYIATYANDETVKTCTVCGQTDHTHYFGYTDTKAASCTTDGLRIYKCYSCDYAYTVTVPRHHSADSGIILPDGKLLATCKLCGEPYITEKL